MNGAKLTEGRPGLGARAQIWQSSDRGDFGEVGKEEEEEEEEREEEEGKGRFW